MTAFIVLLIENVIVIFLSDGPERDRGVSDRRRRAACRGQQAVSRGLAHGCVGVCWWACGVERGRITSFDNVEEGIEASEPPRWIAARRNGARPDE